ncbi:hypothetical protein IG631_20741 [Alternaria alternata]|nr:hypothetical protein IG631_20741 [Alternaria alternata]
MAATLDGQHTPAKPIAIRSAGMKLDPPHIHNIKTLSASVDIMSPVNQNGCFEFDRIIKAGTVVKRTRKTKARTHARDHRGMTSANTCTAMEARLHRPAPQLPLHLQGQARDQAAPPDQPLRDHSSCAPEGLEEEDGARLWHLFARPQLPPRRIHRQRRSGLGAPHTCRGAHWRARG